MVTFLISVLLSLGNVGAYAILAVGIVMIYRASKVLNLAHGAMAMLPAYVVLIMNGGTLLNASAPTAYRFFAALIPSVAVGPLIGTLLGKRTPRLVRIVAGSVATAISILVLMWVAKRGAPVPLALAIGLLSGGALGYLVERVFVRTLRPQGPTAQTVGTVAALGIVVAISGKLFGTGVQTSVHIVSDKHGLSISQSFIPAGQILLFLFAMLLTGLLILLLQKTDLGLVMRGTAENRRAASLMGIDPDKTTAVTWILGGALAGLSGILLASVTNLSPTVLTLQSLPAFVAALLGGMASLPGAVAGAGIVGVTFSVVPILGPLQNLQGGSQLFLALGAVAAMVFRGQRIVGGDVRSESIAAAGKGSAGRGLGPLEGSRRPLLILGVGAFLLLPFMPFVDSAMQSGLNDAARNSLIAVSLVILIGWVGQISLGHAALVGIGGYVTGWVTGGFGIPFPLSLPVAALFTAGIAALLGMVAVRVRGLFLAVATLIFSWMGSEFLFRQQWFIKHSSIKAAVIGRAGSFPFFDFRNDRTFYYIAWAIIAIALLAAANLRDSKTGRAFFAVQGSEMAAASLGVDVTRYKVLAFVVSGFIAGAAGNLLMVQFRTLNADNLAFNYSLLFVAIAVVGGLRSLGGAVGAGILFAMLNVVQYKVTWLNGYVEVAGAALLAVVLLAYPGGLAALGRQIANAAGGLGFVRRGLRSLDRGIDIALRDVGWARARINEKVRERLNAPALEAVPGVALPAATPIPDLGPIPVSGGQDPPVEPIPPVARRSDDGRSPSRAIVRADHVTVRFGGLTAVNDVTLEVREGEIVGLIGPNGAGKTVSFNSIAGIVVPTEGRIELYDTDVTNAPVHVRAELGIARTFQVLQLFPALTIFDNLLVATHLHNRTGLLSHVVAAPAAVEAEREARARVHEVVELLGLHDVVDTYPGDLPFGTLRMVEVARALVTGLRFVMLDEAASGLDDKETEALVDALMKVRRELGITILLIEHDVKLVMGVSDYVYVLDRGTLIAQGPPSIVQRDPKVIEAYLGKSGSENDAELEEARV